MNFPLDYVIYSPVIGSGKRLAFTCKAVVAEAPSRAAVALSVYTPTPTPDGIAWLPAEHRVYSTAPDPLVLALPTV